MKNNNQGFSLVELIVSMAITAIIAGSVASFMAQSTRYYKKTSEEISLQMEAQTVLNQLNDLILEANNVVYDSTTKILQIQCETKLYKITFDSTDNALKFTKTTRNSDGTFISTAEVPFGDYFIDFNIVDTSPGNNNVIKVSFKLKGNISEYEVKDSIIILRNRIQPMLSDWPTVPLP